MALALGKGMTNMERYRWMLWLKERGSLWGLLVMLMWGAGVIWMLRVEGMSSPDTFEDEEVNATPVGVEEIPTPVATHAPARLMAPRAEPAPVLGGRETDDVSWKLSDKLAETIQRGPWQDQHAVVTFREGVRYRRACEVMGLVGVVITSSSYYGSYRIGVVGSGRALESLARYPEVFRLDAR